MAAITFCVPLQTPMEDLSLAERCATQHSGKDLGTAIGAFTTQSLLQSGLQSKEGNGRTSFGCGEHSWYLHTLVCRAQSNKGKKEKHWGQLGCFTYLWEWIWVKISSQLTNRLMISHFNSTLRFHSSKQVPYRSLVHLPGTKTHI